jgi:predicted nucleic acid-binding protein
MTVVIADTSPLNYLVLIAEIELLPQLYGTIVIPREVFLERDLPITFSVLATLKDLSRFW